MRRIVCRLGMVGAAAAAAALGVAPLAAHADTGEGGTGASAAEVGNDESNLAVSNASADAGGGSAEAHPVAGGDQTAGGSSEDGSGGVDTAEHNPDGQLGRAQVMAWEAEADGYSAESSTVLLRVTANNEAEGDVADVAILQSEASDGGGTAEASGDAARVSLGGDQLVVTVLHAEASGDGSGTAYVLGINDQQVMSSEQAEGRCAGEVPGAFRIECFKVAAASGEAMAAVAEASVGEDQLGASVFAAQASPSSVVTSDGGFTSTDFSSEFSSDFSGTDSGGFAGALARTGIDLIPLALAGLMLLVTGAMAMAGTRDDVVA